MNADTDLDTEEETDTDERDDVPEMNLGDSCAHDVREDRDCMACHAEGCPGGGSCGCPGNAPPSKRHLFHSNY